MQMHRLKLVEVCTVQELDKEYQVPSEQIVIQLN